jgi:hypothetical protein
MSAFGGEADKILRSRSRWVNCIGPDGSLPISGPAGVCATIEISNPGEPIVPVERFIDGYQSRNERLADFMRRMSICEEKSSGIDRVVHQAEAFQLPAPDFRAGYRRTIVIVYGPKPFEEMDREDRVRARYPACPPRFHPPALWPLQDVGLAGDVFGLVSHGANFLPVPAQR